MPINKEEQKVYGEIVKNASNLVKDKANPNCKRCYGRGVEGVLISIQENNMRPAICKCTSKKGK